MTTDQVAALVWVSDGMTIDPRTGICYLNRPRPAWAADTVLLAAAAATGRTTHTRPQVLELVAAAGYGRSLGPTLYRHPLLDHQPRGLWAVRRPQPGR